MWRAITLALSSSDASLSPPLPRWVWRQCCLLLQRRAALEKKMATQNMAKGGDAAIGRIVTALGREEAAAKAAARLRELVREARSLREVGRKGRRWIDGWMTVAILVSTRTRLFFLLPFGQVFSDDNAEQDLRHLARSEAVVVNKAIEDAGNALVKAMATALLMRESTTQQQQQQQQQAERSGEEVEEEEHASMVSDGVLAWPNGFR